MLCASRFLRIDAIRLPSIVSCDCDCVVVFRILRFQDSQINTTRVLSVVLLRVCCQFHLSCYIRVSLHCAVVVVVVVVWLCMCSAFCAFRSLHIGRIWLPSLSRGSHHRKHSSSRYHVLRERERKQYISVGSSLFLRSRQNTMIFTTPVVLLLVFLLSSVSTLADPQPHALKPVAARRIQRRDWKSYLVPADRALVSYGEGLSHISNSPANAIH